MNKTDPAYMDALAAQHCTPSEIEDYVREKARRNPERYSLTLAVGRVVVSDDWKDGNPLFDAVNAEKTESFKTPLLLLREIELDEQHPLVSDPSPIRSWEADLPCLVKGNHLLNGSPLRYWRGSLPRLENGEGFAAKSSLVEWTEPLPSLVSGESMFEDVASLTSWQTELPSLVNGNSMFRFTGVDSWQVALPRLKSAYAMFANTPLEEWDVPTPALAVGDFMFAFGQQGKRLTRFRGSLESLTSGKGMFAHANLDLESVRCVAETIKDVSATVDGWLHPLDLVVNRQEALADKARLNTYLDIIRKKGWQITNLLV